MVEAVVILTIGHGRELIIDQEKDNLYLRTKTLPDICLAETKNDVNQLISYIERLKIHVKD